MSTESNKFLTQKQAEYRASIINQNSIKYNLYLNYLKGDSFQAIANIEFSVNSQQNLFFDFQFNKLEAYYINGTRIENPQHNGLFLQIPAEHLKLDTPNQVQISYTKQYADDGQGLHSFIDADGKQYLYSQCEPYYCNKIFPCFDQPDLKATLTLVSSCPSDWIMLFNENETSLNASATAADFEKLITTTRIPEFDSLLKTLQPKVAVFPVTQLLPTYLFGFIAGPFFKIPSKGTNYKNLPMSLYSRESLAVHLERMADFMFEVTNQCMEFYEKYFETPYYFSKYDQVFCPEYNAGAMENAGLVTFNDLYVFREEVDASRITGLTNTITHEMAHHWFGNLVTMKWWNDLWLNESFADFISHYCISKINVTTRKLSNIWIGFNTRKSWGYRTDQLKTTHPIAGNVADTEAAENVFDGITYSKGAATLRQLMSLIGEENFGKAMGHYFNKFAWKNTVLSDFIDSLQLFFQDNGLGFSLKDWQYEWIQTAGLNEIQPIFDPSQNSPQSELKIRMTPALAQHPTLRRHKIQIAFFRADGSIDVQDALLSAQELNVVHYDGSQGYKAVMLNYNDLSFVKLLLDDASLLFYKTNLHTIKDELTRTLIWRSFFDMARDGKLSSEEYIDIFISAISKEASDENIKTSFMYIEGALANFTPKVYQEVLSRRLFDFSLQFLLQTDPSNLNRMLIIRDKVVSFARDIPSIKTLVDWYYGRNESLKPYPIGLQNQWSIVAKVNKKKEFTNEEKDSILNDQTKADPTDTSKLYKIRSDASRANEQELERLWNEYVNPNLENPSMSVKTLDYSQIGFNNSDRMDLIQKYNDLWWSSVIEVFTKQPTERARSFYSNLFPQSDDLKQIEEKLTALLKQVPESQFTLSKSINESIDDIERRQRAYACFTERASLAKKQ